MRRQKGFSNLIRRRIFGTERMREERLGKNTAYLCKGKICYICKQLSYESSCPSVGWSVGSSVGSSKCKNVHTT